MQSSALPRLTSASHISRSTAWAAIANRAAQSNEDSAERCREGRRKEPPSTLRRRPRAPCGEAPEHPAAKPPSTPRRSPGDPAAKSRSTCGEVPSRFRLDLLLVAQDAVQDLADRAHRQRVPDL